MPMAVSPNRRLLYAASRSKPYTVHVYSIDPGSGALKAPVHRAPRGELPVHLARPERALPLRRLLWRAPGERQRGRRRRARFWRSLAADPGGPQRHSILVDASNRYVYVPNLGTDQIFQFRLRREVGAPCVEHAAVAQMKQGTGPRHFIFSPDNRFVYLLSELVATVTTLSLDAKTGLLTEVSSATALLPIRSSSPARRAAESVHRAAPPPRNTDNDIWAADLHLAPGGKIPVRLGAHLQHPGRVRRRRGERETHLSLEHADGEAAARIRDRSKGRFLVATGEKSETISLYAIDPASGSLRLLQKYPTGKGSKLGGDRRFRLTQSVN